MEPEGSLPCSQEPSTDLSEMSPECTRPHFVSNITLQYGDFTCETENTGTYEPNGLLRQFSRM
jgi:hypothetical protein